MGLSAWLARFSLNQVQSELGVRGSRAWCVIVSHQQSAANFYLHPASWTWTVLAKLVSVPRVKQWWSSAAGWSQASAGKLSTSATVLGPKALSLWLSALSKVVWTLKQERMKIWGVPSIDVNRTIEWKMLYFKKKKKWKMHCGLEHPAHLPSAALLVHSIAHHDRWWWNETPITWVLIWPATISQPRWFLQNLAGEVAIEARQLVALSAPTND